MLQSTPPQMSPWGPPLPAAVMGDIVGGVSVGWGGGVDPLWLQAMAVPPHSANTITDLESTFMMFLQW